MTATINDRLFSREKVTELLGVAKSSEVISLANRVIESLADGELTVTRPPQTGSIVTQVREPLAAQRFILGDLLATTAEVALGIETGWAMRLDDDRQATLAQAVLDAEILRGGPHADEALALAEEVDDQRRDRRAAEWAQLAATIVEFQEIT